MMGELRVLVDKFKNNISYYKDIKKHYNEHSCRTEYIDPFLKLLGWDVSNEKNLAPQYREVIAENYSNSSDRPDYSMTLKGVAKFFVEAKKPSVDISVSNEAAFQTRKYGWNANHRIAVLTNFEYLIIYDTTFCPQLEDYHNTARYRIYHYSEYEAEFETIYELLSRNSVYDGRFDEFYNNELIRESLHRKPVDEFFLEQINSWRISLSNSLLSEGSKYKNIEKLNDVVQEFINQIVFLRICEDKNLPLYHSLNDAIETETEVKAKLEQLFRAADKRYNSGIFERNNIIFDLNNRAIIEMIESLYYPKSPFMFNIIEPNLLGRIYEVFLTEQLDFSESGNIVLKKKKECVNRSVVTTPTEIVKYMVSMTLEPLCRNKTPDEVLELKIADIACGSGIFLEEVYDYLVQYCVDWYEKNRPEELIEIGGGRKKIPLNLKKQILTSCIYGIDIDIHAVEVAKFSLIIKLFEDETSPSVVEASPILPKLDKNFLHGNSLIDYKDILNENTPHADLIEVVPFDWREINNGEKFTAIIGNPPYVKTEDMHSLLPKMEFDLYKKKYKTAHKQFDKYFMFIERAIEKIDENGLVCFIVPNKFIKIASGEKLRELISNGRYLLSLDDFGDMQLFAEKTIYSSIVLLNKKSNDLFAYSKVQSAASLWAGEAKTSIDLNANMLGDLPWKLTTDFDFMKLLKQIDERAVPIIKHIDIFNGIQTSAERPLPVYWFSRDQIVNESNHHYTIEKEGYQYTIEKEILKPYFKPSKKSEKGLNSYSYISRDKWIIFPYDESGKLISVDIMKDKFSGAYEYLMAYYDRLVPKQVDKKGTRDVPNSSIETWYQYGRSQGLTSFIDTPKLIVGILSKEPMYAYDNNNYLIASGGTAGYCAITKKSASPYAIEYIQAWLSSDFIEKILRVMGSDFENGFIARGTYILQTLPFIELDLSLTEHRAIHDEIVQKTQRVYDINKQLDMEPDKHVMNVLLREKERLIHTIQEKVNTVIKMEI